MIIKIRKRTRIEWLLLYVVLAPFFFFLMMDVIGLSSFVKYTVDIAWLALLGILVSTKRYVLNRQTKKLICIITAFVLVSLLGFLGGFQSVFYYLWGFRNNIRFFVFFVACIVYLDRKNADALLSIMDKIFYINLFVTLFQFFALGIKQDYLGGVFGVSKGCNAYTNIFLVLVVSCHLLRYMNGLETFKECVLKCLFSLLIAALAELKMFFLEFVLIVVLASVFTRFSSRKLWITLAAIVSFAVMMHVLDILFPHFKNWFAIGKIWDSLTSSSGYTNTNDMNRLTSIYISWNRYLDTGFRKMFGLGLGNCDYASGYEFLTTPFYNKHSQLHYMWFLSSFLILETGLVGLSVYIYFFIQVFFCARERERQKTGMAFYCQLAKIIAILCPILVIYDSSLRTEAAYMIFFTLALPFIRLEKSDNRSYRSGEELLL